MILNTRINIEINVSDESILDTIICSMLDEFDQYETEKDKLFNHMNNILKQNIKLFKLNNSYIKEEMTIKSLEDFFDQKFYFI